MNILEKLFIQYHANSNNKIELEDKINFIQKKLSIEEPIALLFIGILNDLLVNMPQYYYNKDVKREIFDNLNSLFIRDNEKFIDSFYKYQDKFFHAINSYYNILDLYNEFDDVDFDSETKAKIYYIPIITQLMEFSLSHIYKNVLYIINEFEEKDYTKQTKLGQLKDNLKKFNYKYLIDIDIDFRNAVSHGNIELNTDGIILTEKNIEIKYYQLNKMKNKLIDITSGAILGLIDFIVKKNIINPTYLSKINEKVQYEYLKLFLHNENIKVKSFSQGVIGSSQLNINLDIQGINDKNQIIYILITVGKILYATFNNYDRYFISYKHPFSISGFLTLENSKLQQILYEDDISNIDAIISQDLGILIPDIQKTNVDNRSYKFHIFLKISGSNWEVISIKDISVENIKRFKAKLVINEKTISKKEVESLIFQITKKIRVLENKANPTTKIKYGKIEADVVRLSIFYKTDKRDSFSLFRSNETFICLAHYYKSKSIVKIEVPFQDNYIYENIKKLDIYWNKNCYSNMELQCEETI